MPLFLHAGCQIRTPRSSLPTKDRSSAAEVSLLLCSPPSRLRAPTRGLHRRNIGVELSVAEESGVKIGREHARGVRHVKGTGREARGERRDSLGVWIYAWNRRKYCCAGFPGERIVACVLQARPGQVGPCRVWCELKAALARRHCPVAPAVWPKALNGPDKAPTSPSGHSPKPSYIKKYLYTFLWTFTCIIIGIINLLEWIIKLFITWSEINWYTLNPHDWLYSSHA